MTDVFSVGDRVFITLSADIAPGWRVYSLESPGGRPLELELENLPPGLLRHGNPSESATRQAHDPGLNSDYTYHEGRARIWQALRVGDHARAGEHVVSGRLRYAACNDEMCLPVRSEPFRVSFQVAR